MRIANKAEDSETVVGLIKVKGRAKQTFIDNIEYYLMSAPALVLVFIFSYIPMFGVVIAFKDFRYDKGILGSTWVGLKNFEFFFSSQDAWRITRNTLCLNAIFIVTSLIAAVVFALVLYEIKRRITIKIYQTIMILPHFLSWVIVGYMLYAFLNPEFGFLNRLLNIKIDWYSKPEYWPSILIVVNMWKGVGMNCIMYYAALMSIDNSYFEAAALDGASKFQMTRYITIPFLVPLMTILTILHIGNIFRADFGMFYQLTRNVGALYSTTDVIDTYIFRALKNFGDIGMSSAVGLFQSFVGFVLVVTTNHIVNKIEPDNALF